jgi:hypothetical protein
VRGQNKHAEYFPALEKLCKERREANFERWQRLCGSKIGASEFIIKGGQSPQPEPAADTIPSDTTALANTASTSPVAPAEAVEVQSVSLDESQSQVVNGVEALRVQDASTN